MNKPRDLPNLPPPQSADPRQPVPKDTPVPPGQGQIPGVLRGLGPQERVRIERAAEILESTEDLIWYSGQMGETIAQTRLHFEKIMCGIDTDEPKPRYRDAVVGDLRPPRSEMSVVTSEMVGQDDDRDVGEEKETEKELKRKTKRKASSRLSDDGGGTMQDAGGGRIVQASVKEEDVAMEDVDREGT